MSGLLRARGLGLFSITATSGISPKILESVGTFIIFQLPQKAQSEKIAKTLNLDLAQEALLRYLPDGRAIVKKIGSSTPILIQANTLEHESIDMKQLIKNNKSSLPQLISKRKRETDTRRFKNRHEEIWKTLLPILQSPITKNPMLNWLRASGFDMSEGELNDTLKKHIDEISMAKVKDFISHKRGYSMIYCLRRYSRNPKIWYMLNPLYEKLQKLGLNVDWLENHSGIVVKEKIVIRYFDGSALVITKNPPPAAPFPIHVYVTSRLTASRINKWARRNQEPVFAFEQNVVEGNKELINRLTSGRQWSWGSNKIRLEKAEEVLERS
jgi:hypothetical protein